MAEIDQTNNSQENEEFNGKYFEEEEEEFNDQFFEEEEKTESFFIEEEDYIDTKLIQLKHIETTFKVFMYGVDCILKENKSFEINIPRTFLPITLQIAYGFMQHDIAINLIVNFHQGWNDPSSKAFATHPITGPNYTGSILVKDSISHFFKKDYQPKSYYQSVPYFFITSTSPDRTKVSSIVGRGFTEMQANKALSLCHNDIEKSLIFLQTGQIDMGSNLDAYKPPVSYNENPLIYLVLEIADSIFDVQNHCSICRERIPAGIKPSTCEKESCKFSFINIGIGTSIIQEIKRDILVADLLITCFMCALNDNFMEQMPPDFKSIDHIKLVFRRIPSLKEILEKYSDDSSLCSVIGSAAFNLLRWIILSNRSQLFYLPKKIEIESIASPSAYQFMALLSSPEQEGVFQQLKSKYGSMYMWHGSPVSRWHSIIRTGLVVGARKRYGPCNAIFMAANSATSLGYARNAINSYRHSKFGKNIHIIALMEVINLPSLQNVVENVSVRDPITGKRYTKQIGGVLTDNYSVKTLTMEEACIVRCIIVNLEKQVDINSNPPDLPSLIDILNAQAQI